VAVRFFHQSEGVQDDRTFEMVAFQGAEEILGMGFKGTEIPKGDTKGTDKIQRIPLPEAFQSLGSDHEAFTLARSLEGFP